MHEQICEGKDACRNMLKRERGYRHKDKHSKLLYTHPQKQRPAFVQVHTDTHTDTHIVSAFSLQSALPEMLLPSGPQSNPSTLITGRQAGRTVFYISQGALQAHNTLLVL